jgi:outer membrane protein OmpA-like peptidoglycan-associated protein
MVLAALAGLAVSLPAAGAIAESKADAPSQSEIERGLKTRGLPTLGTAPAPQANPGVVPANVPSVPRAAAPRDNQYQPARRLRQTATPASHPAHAASAQPSVALKTITFKFGSTELNAESVETLRNLGNALNQGLNEEKVFVIEGHTDKTGTRVYNEELAKQRAEAVKDYLVKELGVSPDRLQAVGKGFSEPANPRNPFGAENRRVVVINIGAS